MSTHEASAATEEATRKARLDGRREILGEAGGAHVRHDDCHFANAFAINL